MSKHAKGTAPIEEPGFFSDLEVHAPELSGGAKASQAKESGRKSEEARILDDLNAYAAHELCRTRKFPRKCVIKLICHPKGRRHFGCPVYGKEDELTRPLQRFSRRLWEFRNDLMANLTPLEPLQKLGPRSQPDWTLLEQAIAAHPEQWEGSPSDIKDLKKLFRRFKRALMQYSRKNMYFLPGRNDMFRAFRQDETCRP